MNTENKKAPEMISEKDLDYLKDIFGWNHTAYKMMQDALKNVQDRKVEKVISDCAKLFYKNLTNVLTIIKEVKNNE